MNKIALIALILLLSIAAKAQVGGNYTFSKLTGTYTDLPTGKTIIQSAWLNPFSNLTFTAPIDLEVFSTATDATDFMVDSRGRITYDPTFISGTFFISGFGDDLHGIATSQVAEASYIVDGTYPDQILKVQFKRAGFVSESVHSSYIHFQIWLYETSDIIEMRYGPSSITSSQAVPGDIGIFHEDGFGTLNSIEVYGISASPTADTGVMVDGQHLTDVPANGTIYRFTPTTVNIEEKNTSEKIITLYDPARKVIIVNVPGYTSALSCDIYNIAGQKICSATLNEKTNRIPVNDIASGLYVIKTFGKKGTSICKILL